METFTKEQKQEAEAFAAFYFDLVENHRERLMYYLSDDALLDWFGKTINGMHRINDFARHQLGKLEHSFPSIEPCLDIGYRQTHVIKCKPSASVCTEQPAEYHAISEVPTDKTPPNPVIPSNSRKREIGQGDGLHNCHSDSPAKRTKIASGSGDVAVPITIEKLTSSGRVTFYSQSSKKYQRETKWSRPCNFQVAYSKTSDGYIIHLIIYHANMKCRRSLLKEFDALSSLSE